jgi:hypothetical protein
MIMIRLTLTKNGGKELMARELLTLKYHHATKALKDDQTTMTTIRHLPRRTGQLFKINQPQSLKKISLRSYNG